MEVVQLPAAQLTLKELCDEVNKRWRRYHPKRGDNGNVIDGRTVRFYIAKELIPGVRTGPGGKYPPETVWRVLFIRLLQHRHRLSLDQVRLAMRQVPVETMQRVVTGEEPLEVRGPDDREAVERHLAEGYQVVPLPLDHGGEALTTSDWDTLVSTADLQISVRDDLPPGKRRQLEQLAALARSIVAED
jgi:DNA-binding transcriptional MerR regulator